MSRIVAALRKVTKAYPGVLACRSVSIEFRSGEIHAILGENGAGKSTLVKMLAGLVQPDEGNLEVAGRAVRLNTPRKARDFGIGVVHQQGTLIDSLTVDENLRLVNGIDRGSSNAAVALIADDLLRRRVESLSPRERRLVEIHRLLSLKPDLLVLDEPTAALTPQESDMLFEDLRRLAAQGLAVLIVSHKLPEIVKHAPATTILKRGVVTERIPAGQVTIDRLLQAFGNGAAGGAYYGSRPKKPQFGGTIVELRNASWRATDGEQIHGLNFTAKRREIVGLAGHPRSGCSALLSLLAVERRPTQGTLSWMTKGPPQVGFIPSDRNAEGGIPSFSIAQNLALRRRHLLGRGLSFWRNDALDSFAQEMIRKFNIVPTDPSARLSSLSGGNLQKMILAREIDSGTDLLLADNPLAGLDLNSAAFVRARLREQAESGAAVIIYSPELEDLIGLADRVVVLSKGQAVATLEGQEITDERIGRALLTGSAQRG